ncbi:MAG: TauD/TfdA family dioxygenase [Betaproteobacteria bacterium]|nr:TauD/TfdA family dioxygenase [Betaproteobacteria bacterium]
MNFNCTPIKSHFGAQITELNLKQAFDEETKKQLYEALIKYKVLLFRGVELSEIEQVRLSTIAGDVAYRGSGNYSDPNKLSSLVSNAHPDGLFGNGELSFHSDLSFTPHILKARSLHGLIIPNDSEIGGETLFSDVALAYEELDPKLKEDVETLQARFSATYTYPNGESITLDHTRPLIDTHPYTGQRFISASRAVTKEVLGMQREQFRPLLKALWSHIENPRYVYRHQWRTYDTLLWDNIATQHARTPFDSNVKRALRAVSIDDRSISLRDQPFDLNHYAEA